MEFMIDLLFGRVPGVTPFNVFGSNKDNASAIEDVWSGGAAWVPPTTARIHAIASTSTDDDEATGQGTHTIRVHGLTSWSTTAVTEDITMDGTVSVNTVNSYVMINHMEVLTSGTNGPNVGVITATAATDATVSDRIPIGDGHSQSTFIGIPSGETLYLTGWSAGIEKTQSAAVDVRLRINNEPDSTVGAFHTEHTMSIHTQGNTASQHEFLPFKILPGPSIVKVDANPSANSSSVTAGLDGFIRVND